MRYTILFLAALIATPALAQVGSDPADGNPFAPGDAAADGGGGDAFDNGSANPFGPGQGGSFGQSDFSDVGEAFGFGTRAKPGQVPGGLPGEEEGSGTAAKIPNPFDAAHDGIGMQGDMEMMMMGDEMMEEGMMDVGGMDMMAMSGGFRRPSEEDIFQRGLQLAISQLRQTEKQENKNVLLGYVKKAFEERYDKSIAKRRKELQQIKNRVVQLEKNLARREAAKQRVLEVQLQSVQLAAEGLLEMGGR
ncbi:MAG: hypothetical protein MI861_20855 [Pirellulales bacterium]|nr:hypothetical protein [Pirellulales bacterium]